MSANTFQTVNMDADECRKLQPKDGENAASAQNCRSVPTPNILTLEQAAVELGIVADEFSFNSIVEIGLAVCFQLERLGGGKSPHVAMVHYDAGNVEVAVFRVQDRGSAMAFHVRLPWNLQFTDQDLIPNQQGADVAAASAPTNEKGELCLVFTEALTQRLQDPNTWDTQKQDLETNLALAVLRAVSCATGCDLERLQELQLVVRLRACNMTKLDAEISDWQARRLQTSPQGRIVALAKRYVRLIERSSGTQRIQTSPSPAPSARRIKEVCDLTLQLLLGASVGARRGALVHHDRIAEELSEFEQKLISGIRKSFLYEDPELCRRDAYGRANEIAIDVCRSIPDLAELMNLDAKAGFENDPSVMNPAQFAMMSPGLRAIALYRMAHRCYQLGAEVFARLITEEAHSRYAIDIHPGASIGEAFTIDHGSGVVIGQTTDIGANCTIYQAVTLGAFKFPRDQFGNLSERGFKTKRHPTLEDNVTVYSNASILGGDTIVGRYSVVGANVRLTRSVPAESVVTFQQHPPNTPKVGVKQRSVNGSCEQPNG